MAKIGGRIAYLLAGAPASSEPRSLSGVSKHSTRVKVLSMRTTDAASVSVSASTEELCVYPLASDSHVLELHVTE